MKQTRYWNESKGKHICSRYEIKVTLDRSKKSLGMTFLEQHGIIVWLVPWLPAQVCWSTFRRAAAFSTRTFMSQRTSHHDRSWPFMAIHDPHLMKFLKLFSLLRHYVSSVLAPVWWIWSSREVALNHIREWVPIVLQPFLFDVSTEREAWPMTNIEVEWITVYILKIFWRATLNPCLNNFAVYY